LNALTTLRLHYLNHIKLKLCKNEILFITTIKNFFKTNSYFLGILFSVTVYAVVRTTFHDIPFSVVEDGNLLFKMTLTSCSIIGMLKASWHFLIIVGENLQRFKASNKSWLSQPKLNLPDSKGQRKATRLKWYFKSIEDINCFALP